ncbi:MAG: Sensor protein resE [Candidatus Saccharibacteria bacterium]|nr:Sensor protein resE [Candidatus Saccharibacteria bacterium]
MWLSVGVAILVVLNIFMASFVLARKADKVNTYFAAFTFTAALWMVANYIGSNFKQLAVAGHFAHADFMLGMVAIYFYWMFTLVILQRSNKRSHLAKWQYSLRRYFLVAIILGIVSTLLPSALSITYHDHATVLGYGPLFAWYVLVVGVLACLGVCNMALASRYAKDKLKQQIRLMSTGLATGVVLIIFANIIVPALTDSSGINLLAGNASYLGVVVLASCIFYAIIRHRLFDLRLFVVRAVAYSLTLGVVTCIYLLLIVIVGTRMLHINLDAVSTILSLFAALLLLVCYEFVKNGFNKFTNRLFLRDYYEPQEVIDRLSNVMVGAINADEIEQQSKAILQSAIRTRELNFWLSDEHPFKPKMALDKLFKKTDTNILVLDEVDGHDDIVSDLQAENIAVAVRLRTQRDDLGYITLGFKQSGQSYNSRDKRLLSIAADEIALTLQNALHFEEIQNFNLTLQQKITDATKQLRNTNKRLKSLDETKDDFISMASHQLRTPLTSVKGYISMVLEGDAGTITPLQRQMLNQAFISSQRMVFLIADLLNVSRLKTGKFIIMPSETDLSAIITEESDQLRETAEARQVKIKFDPPKNFPKVMVDETKTRQVVMNFMDNAIYYTRPGGEVTLTLSETPNTIELRIKDNGIGVPKSEQHHLFTKFYRANNARQVRPDGTGLGLFMARKVIVAQGGTIIFESQEGKGSTFGFSLDKKAVLAPSDKSEGKTETVTVR